MIADVLPLQNGWKIASSQFALNRQSHHGWKIEFVDGPDKPPFIGALVQEYYGICSFWGGHMVAISSH